METKQMTRTRSNCIHCNRSFKFHSSRQRHEQMDCPKRPQKEDDMKTKDEVQVERYKEDIMSGRTFALHAMSARSAFDYQPPINHRDWAHAMGAIAQMAAQSDALAAVARVIMGRVNLYGTRSQAQAALYEAAGEALAAGYTDIIGLAGPEPGRRSGSQRDFTLAERVAVMYWLEYAARPFASTAPGVGWCLQAVAESINYQPPAVAAVRRSA